MLGQLAVVATLPLVIDVNEALEGERRWWPIIQTQQETDYGGGWVTVELLAEEDRQRTTKPLDLFAGRLDHEAAAAIGVRDAGYVLLRLPLELRELFREWLLTHFPGKLRHVMSIVQATRGGADYSAKFGERQVGTGVYAELIAKRMRLAMERTGLKKRSSGKLRTDLFTPPVLPGGQLSLF